MFHVSDNLTHFHVSRALRVCSCEMCKHIMNGAGRQPDAVCLLFYRILVLIVFQPNLSHKILTSSLLLLALINTESNNVFSILRIETL